MLAIRITGVFAPLLPLEKVKNFQRTRAIALEKLESIGMARARKCKLRKDSGVLSKSKSHTRKRAVGLKTDRAMERSANMEAIHHLTKGLELLKRLDETTERLGQELEFLTTMGPAYQAIKGFGSPEVRQTYMRAQEITQMVGECPQLFPALWGVWYFHAIRPEEKKAKELGEQLVMLAQDLQDPTLLMVAYRSLGSTLVAYGEPVQALEILRKGIAIYDPVKHRSLAYVYGQDIGVVCRGWVA